MEHRRELFDNETNIVNYGAVKFNLIPIQTKVNFITLCIFQYKTDII